ncbi:thioredoxin-domain-containing protein [Favolaschia claudopus]|uniref:Thioredoxin-domain-containing protein n=1 Tax=Favolaschia claudopus TaxID=2862362 RepID=A0AAW0D6H2_9AGAR
MLTVGRVFRAPTRTLASIHHLPALPASANSHRILPHRTHRLFTQTSDNMSSSQPVEIQSVGQWNDIVESSTAAGKTIVVDFHAVWCSPCKAIAPRYNQLASQHPQVQFLRVDVDEHPRIAQNLLVSQVSAMPTFFAIKNKTVVDMLRGADPHGLARLVKEHAGPNPPVAPSSGEEEEKTTEPTEQLEDAPTTQPTSRL